MAGSVGNIKLKQLIRFLVDKMKRTKEIIIDEIADIMNFTRSISFFKALDGWNKLHLEALCKILKAKNITTVKVNKETEQELCSKCRHQHKTEFGMEWCDKYRERIDDFKNEKVKGESIPTFKVKDNFPIITEKYECDCYKDKSSKTKTNINKWV